MRRDEEISDRRKERDEMLQSAGGSEALHYPFSLSQWQVRIFRSIVQTLVRSMFDGRHHIPLCRFIRAQFVGDDPPWRKALLPQ